MHRGVHELILVAPECCSGKCRRTERNLRGNRARVEPGSIRGDRSVPASPHHDVNDPEADDSSPHGTRYPRGDGADPAQEEEFAMVDNSHPRTSARVRNLARERMERTGEKYTVALHAVVDGGGDLVETYPGAAEEREIIEHGYWLARGHITTLWDVDDRLWKLVGGDQGGSRSAFFGYTPHTVIESRFGNPTQGWVDPAGWNAYVHVGTTVLLKRNYPDVPYSQDDVPARAELHALSMFYWTAVTQTNPRWKTLKGALRFLKPDMDLSNAESAVREDVAMLLRGWELLEQHARGAVDEVERADMQRIRAELVRHRVRHLVYGSSS